MPSIDFQAKADQVKQYIKDKELDRGLLYQRQIEKEQDEKEKQVVKYYSNCILTES